MSAKTVGPRGLRRLVAVVALGLASALGCARSGGGGSASAPSLAPAVAVTSSSSHAAPASTAPPASSTPAASILLAGAAEVDVTPPVGVPLAGYGGGKRRRSFPNLSPTSYDHLLAPSMGIRDPVYARALFISDGKTRVAVVTIDGIATDAEVVEVASAKARAQGSSVALESLMVCASHSHSGPGCLTHRVFWQIAAADLYHDQVFQSFSGGIAKAIVEAERAAVPARIGIGSGRLAGVTENRRANFSPVFTRSSVDPEVLVVRVDRASDGAAIATLWNFAIHGISLSQDSMVYSADIMGGANAELGSRKAGVPLFVNSGEGDIVPIGNYRDDPGIRLGGRVIADEVLAVRARTSTVAAVEVKNTSEVVDFGQPYIDVTVTRTGVLQSIPALQSSGLLPALQSIGQGVGFKFPMPKSWLERQFRYQAIRLGKWGLASIPGEAIHTITDELKAKGKALGFEHVLTCGLANGHMSYVTTEQEFLAGGYEAIATFFGPKTADKLIDSSLRQMTKVKP